MKKRRRIRKIGDLKDARRKLWQAITSAEEVLLDDQSDAVMVLKATHAITSASTAYARLVEAGELEARVSELERVGCNRISVGLEHGNEEFRKTIVGKGFTNQRIIDVFKILDRYSIPITINNMIG
ncbi:MAG: radical SAM protein, partial [Bacteroidetes bacterium]|nr:radical SAM protein [Bacteroidota bacterium]